MTKRVKNENKIKLMDTNFIRSLENFVSKTIDTIIKNSLNYAKK